MMLRIAAVLAVFLLAIPAQAADDALSTEANIAFMAANAKKPGVIVRPDGVVAWRAVDASGVSAQAIHDVLATLVSRRDPVASMRVERADGDAT